MSKQISPYAAVYPFFMQIFCDVIFLYCKYNINYSDTGFVKNVSLGISQLHMYTMHCEISVYNGTVVYTIEIYTQLYMYIQKN